MTSIRRYEKRHRRPAHARPECLRPGRRWSRGGRAFIPARADRGERRVCRGRHRDFAGHPGQEPRGHRAAAEPAGAGDPGGRPAGARPEARWRPRGGAGVADHQLRFQQRASLRGGHGEGCRPVAARALAVIVRQHRPELSPGLRAAGEGVGKLDASGPQRATGAAEGGCLRAAVRGNAQAPQPGRAPRSEARQARCRLSRRAQGPQFAGCARLARRLGNAPALRVGRHLPSPGAGDAQAGDRPPGMAAAGRAGGLAGDRDDRGRR